MASQYRIERNRGIQESGQQFAVLREKWPLAFPVKHRDVRPLAVGVAHEITAAMSWSFAYTLGVLGGWKMWTVYCRAVHCHVSYIGHDEPMVTFYSGVPGSGNMQWEFTLPRERPLPATQSFQNFRRPQFPPPAASTATV